ncbi:phage minor head protein [Paenibacillus sp. JX-17]|uniref:Phage minor head protein n=1 Tax=Paenibacillus lacisoli TaxID=3064525 RepID=A0ABT9CIT1_9BACL|nr:phage minor head protein [Paenibacillus sp. JX-17]MDO7908438.1 phage minor head protein [Paenibacillus sp. JX-17]
MCESCWVLIAKADDDEFLDSLDLNHAERAVLNELYKQGESRVTEILELQGKELLAAILELSEELQVDPDELARLIEDVQSGELFQVKFIEAIQEAFAPLFQYAGETELKALDESKVWAVENTAAARFTSQLEDLVPSMNDTTKDVMLRSLERAIAEGATPSERALLVQEVSRTAAEGEEGPFSMQRAQRVARTFSTAAANGGKLEGWRQSEIAKGKRWRSAAGTRTRKSHRKANNQVVPLEKPFDVGDSKLMHPGDPAGESKEIVNCRCSMQLVID